MFGFFKKKKKEDSVLVLLIKKINSECNYVYGPNDIKDVEDFEALKKRSPVEIKLLVIDLLQHYIEVSKERAKLRKGDNYNSELYFNYAPRIVEALVSGLLRRKLDYNEKEWMDLFEQIGAVNKALKKLHSFNLGSLPINYAIKQIEYYQKVNPISSQLKDFVKNYVLKWSDFDSDQADRYYGSNLTKAAKKLTILINEGVENMAYKLQSNDIGFEVNAVINELKDKQSAYNQIFHLASSVTASKPGVKFIKEFNKHLDELGLENYKRVVHQLLQIPLGLKFESVSRTYDYPNGSHEYTETIFLSTKSQQLIKGLVWTCNRYSDKETISVLIRLAEKCYTKIPGKGPAAASVGNACVYILGNMKGKDGLGALSRLRLKVKQNNVKKSIDKLLLVGAEKYNISVEELKEMAVPHYGIVSGAKRVSFGDYNLDIKLKGTKFIQQWIKPDGALMKSVPAVVKSSTSFKNKLKDVRKELKDIQKVFSAQKQRIDNQLILDRQWDYPSFKKYYLDHGIVSPIAIKLIWTISLDDKTANVIYLNERWESVGGEVVDWIDDDSTVKLWHPVTADETTIVNWRKKIEKLEWSQPIKQAFREIYILTDAELNTKSYSNRMAAHLLKQHQFNSLATIRDWKYSLLGAYDNGIDSQLCSKFLPEHGITAEFWIDEMNQDDAYNDAGIWLYIATDQVKFKDQSNSTIDLIDVPKIVFTEIMRDVDMFVGVCSVGNDPQWIDNNGARQTNRDYWHSYSFGDLSEIAKTRKDVLQGLLPRLKKIRDKSHIEGKFLIVKGSVRTYKIHIGSGNILMEPNDQYLCIVPSRSSENSTSSLFIPFEGDRGLSIVLSKAFLLAEDNKIEDPTILSQINRGES